MSPYHGLDWLAMALTFTAVYLVGNRQRNGFLLMNARNYRSWPNELNRL
ncbi:hypothetical protein QWZ03_17220 [Chitinimonas viridis]|uniref:Uncharacterized protein n=1 Tax=Chitinimonas viridis TaxID=664880 RepID=A0ABT8B8E8_9NEIS|nr:hypothetical protein [Chitinimonas viridis]MDN3578513.1 hypothetical protein [Chitinimonas viridis]